MERAALTRHLVGVLLRLREYEVADYVRVLDVCKTVEHVVVPRCREDDKLVVDELLRQIVFHALNVTVEQLRRKPDAGVLEHGFKPADAVELRNGLVELADAEAVASYGHLLHDVFGVGLCTDCFPIYLRWLPPLDESEDCVSALSQVEVVADAIEQVVVFVLS